MKARFLATAELELKEAMEFYEDEILIVSVMDLRRDPKRWEHFL